MILKSEEGRTIDKKHLKVLGKVLTLACLIFVVISVMREGAGNLDFLKKGEVRRMLLGLVAVFSSLILLHAYIWKSLLATVSKRAIRYKVALDIYIRANIYKYLPGNVMHLVGRNIIGALYDLKQVDIALATAVELISAISASVLIIVIYYYQNLEEVFRIWSVFPIEPGYGIFVAILAGVVIAVVLLRKNIKHFLTVLDEKLTRILVRQLVKTVVLHIGALLVSGLCYALLLKVMLPDGQLIFEYTDLIVAYIVAWFFGFITPGSPGGIGVREAVLILILGSVFPRDIIIASTILMRLITVMGDFGTYGFLIAIKGIVSFVGIWIRGKDVEKIR